VRQKIRRFLKFKNQLARYAALPILTVIVHSAVWSLVDMGMYLSVLINFFPLCLITLLHLKKSSGVSGAPVHRLWKDLLVAKFKLLLYHLPGGY
jgi:hypothetical protein